MNDKNLELPDTHIPELSLPDLDWIIPDPTRILLSYLIRKVVAKVTHRWKALDTQMPKVDRAFNLVRDELREVGLLDDGDYLDQIDLYVSFLPSRTTAGYVYEDIGLRARLVGYEEGTIYLPRNLPQQAYVPGATLTDVIRHEFAHAWHWLEPQFFERAWFRKAFSLKYDDITVRPYDLWAAKMARSRKYKKSLEKRRTKNAREDHLRQYLLKDFVSVYAATAACEDFAETFMMFLRYRNSLSRFSSRPGVYRKLRAVERAVKTARRELGL